MLECSYYDLLSEFSGYVDELYVLFYSLGIWSILPLIPIVVPVIAFFIYIAIN